MPPSTFIVFQDQDASSSVTTASSSKHSQATRLAATKENINPLTGVGFGAHPPLRKRKLSSSSALKAKPITSTGKPSTKSKRYSSASSGKEMGNRKTMLCPSGTKNTPNFSDVFTESETEQLRAALGNRNAYDLTVMPLADITQAYDEGEAASAVRINDCMMEGQKQKTVGMVLHTVSEETDVDMHDIVSKEIEKQVEATQD